MFPEYRDLISQLKQSDKHFARLFDEHNELDEKITELEKHISPVGEVEIETLKKQKLALKDENRGIGFQFRKYFRRRSQRW